MFCIETELEESLRGINGSELVNRLLLEFFEGDYGENPKKLRSKYTQFKAEKAIFSAKMKQIVKKLTEIEAKNRKEKQKTMDSVEIMKKKQTANVLVEQWRNEEITDDEYWKAIDKLDGK